MVKFTVIGLFQGATYGLLAAGLVLVHRVTHTLNVAQAEFGGVAAFVTYGSFTSLGLPYGVAAAVGLAAAGAAGILVEAVVVRPLARSSRLSVLLGTTGVALLLIALTVLVAKDVSRILPPALGPGAVVILGAGISRQLLLLAGTALVASGALWFVQARTTAGLATVATGEAPRLAATSGVRSARVSLGVWAVAGLLGGAAGLLQAPIHGVFSPGFMTIETLLPALAAAFLAGMTSVPGAFLAGEVVGVAQSLGQYGLGGLGSVPGAGNMVVFLLLVGTLLARREPAAGREAPAWR